MADAEPAPRLPHYGGMTCVSDAERDDHGARELLRRARRGDEAALAQLYVDNVDAAIRYARRITSPSRAEDIVSEAFLRTFRAMLGDADGGPQDHFRAYLFTTVRRAAIDAQRRHVREVLTLDAEVPTSAVGDGADDRAEASLVMAALEQMPPRYREVIWLSEGLGLSHDEIARRFDSNVNAVGVLRFRAKESLRQAYLAAHMKAHGDDDPAVCRDVRGQLPRYVRGRLSGRRADDIAEHLDQCRDSCAAIARAIDDENSRMGA